MKAYYFLPMLLVAATPPPAPKLWACPTAGHVAISKRIIVQGGISQGAVAGGIAAGAIAGRSGAAGPGLGPDPLAIGPKQDDPAPPAPPADLHSNAAMSGGSGDAHALGPKQDDPGPPPAPDMTSCKK